MKNRVRLSASEARRIALAAQGFDRSRPGGRPDARHFGRTLGRLRLLQLDFVNVLIPAHYLVVWSRLGAYDRSRLETHLYESGRYTEQWAHEASIVPVETWPRLAHRRAQWGPHVRNPLRNLARPEKYLSDVLTYVESNGPVTADEVPQVDGPRRKPGDWHRPMARWALEHHFARGDLAVRRRKSNFQRMYDLPDRVIPKRQLERQTGPEQARRELLEAAAAALGVATLQDLADYFRMSPRSAAIEIARLESAGRIRRIDVEGWGRPAYLHREARLPRKISAASLLSPFDPLVWYRPRTERLFDFFYRIEIYVPEVKRRWGYYVLPFLLGDELVARVDLKADRLRRRLLVRHAYIEDGCDSGQVAAALARELTALAGWLDLDVTEVRTHNRFSSRLLREQGMTAV